MDEFKETLALYRVRSHQLAKAPDQERTIYQAATKAFGCIPAVEGILIEQEGDVFAVWTVVDQLGEQTEAWIYQMEGQLMDEFPSEGFDFHILVRRGRPLEEFVAQSRIAWLRFRSFPLVIPQRRFCPTPEQDGHYWPWMYVFSAS